MPILDIFKKKEEEGKAKDLKPVEKKEEKKISGHFVSKKFVLKSPYITEKGTMLEKENKYTFKVLNDSNKVEIKKEIEEKYNVNVLNVNIINAKRKKRRIGKHQGFKKGYKKAIVEIKKGQKIELV